MSGDRKRVGGEGLREEEGLDRDGDCDEVLGKLDGRRFGAREGGGGVPAGDRPR